MGSKRGKNSQFSATSHRANYLAKTDKLLIDHAQTVIESLREKYSLSADDVAKILSEDVQFPLSILVKELTPLHSVVKYLKENRSYSYAEIGKIIGRDQRNIWRIYNDASKKFPAPFSDTDDMWLSISVLKNPILSAQEALVAHLHDQRLLSFAEIAQIMKRDDRTIWTVYQRAKKKHANK